MNAILSAEHPLPRCLYDAADSRHRRRRIGAYRIDPSAVARFNIILHRFEASAPELDPDRLATAARQLACPGNAAPPACIRERLFRVKAARAMASDAAWRVPQPTEAVVRALLRQVQAGEHVIPPDVPGVAHLDDALLVDAAWGVLGREVEDYVDFHRLRKLACAPGQRTGFDAAAWLRARDDERRLRHQRDACRFGSYLAAPTARFLVH